MKSSNLVLIAALLLVWNIVVFLIYGIDKQKAKKGKWRLPEGTLLLMAFLFGSLGAFCGMHVFHHKTQHKKFILVPIFLCLHLGLLIWWIVS